MINNKQLKLILVVIFLYLFYLHYQVSTNNSSNANNNESTTTFKKNDGEAYGGRDEKQQNEQQTSGKKNLISFSENQFLLVTKTKVENLPFMAIHDPKLCCISDGINKNGYHEKEESLFVLQIFQVYPSNNAMIDLGANVGWFTLLSLSQGKTVFSFEPANFNLEVFFFTLSLYSPSFRKNLFQFPLPITSESKKGTEYCFLPAGNNLGDNFGNFQAKSGDCKGFYKKGFYNLFYFILFLFLFYLIFFLFVIYYFLKNYSHYCRH